MDEARAALFPVFSAPMRAPAPAPVVPTGHTPNRQRRHRAGHCDSPPLGASTSGARSGAKLESQRGQRTKQCGAALANRAPLRPARRSPPAYMELIIADAHAAACWTIQSSPRCQGAQDHAEPGRLVLQPRSDVISRTNPTWIRRIIIRRSPSASHCGQYEHAIAVLAGMPPADLTIPPVAQPPRMPDIPVSVPSTLLERRPDIAAAERTMASNNALIGVAVAAYYPAINLSSAFGFAAGGFTGLFSAANDVWSFGGTASDEIFAFGARSAAVAAARAQYRSSVATYRQTVPRHCNKLKII